MSRSPRGELLEEAAHRAAKDLGAKDLPEDVWFYMAEKFFQEPELKAIVLVTRGLNKCLTPCLYRSYDCQYRFRESGDKRFWPFLRTLLRKPLLRNEVRHLRLALAGSGLGGLEGPAPLLQFSANDPDEGPLYERVVSQYKRNYLPDIELRLGVDYNIHACEEAEVGVLLSLTPNIVSIRFDCQPTTKCRVYEKEFWYRVMHQAGIMHQEAQDGHGRVWERLEYLWTMISFRHAHQMEFEYLYKLPKLKTLPRLLWNPQEVTRDNSSWPCAPRTSPIECLLLDLGLPDVAFVNMLARSSKKLRRLAITVECGWAGETDFPIAPSRVMDLSYLYHLHSETLEEMELRLHDPSVLAGALKDMVNLKRLELEFVFVELDSNGSLPPLFKWLPTSLGCLCITGCHPGHIGPLAESMAASRAEAAHDLHRLKHVNILSGKSTLWTEEVDPGVWDKIGIECSRRGMYCNRVAFDEVICYFDATDRSCNCSMRRFELQ